MCFSFGKCDFSEVICNKECQDEYEYANLVSCDDIFDFAKVAKFFYDNVGLIIMKSMSYKGQGLVKHEQGMREPIDPSMRLKYEGVGYVTYRGNDVIGIKDLNITIQAM